MFSMWSSHDPAGGLHFLAVAGGVVSAGWVAFLRDRFVGAAAAVPLDAGRPRFLPRAAVSVCLYMLSRPPIWAKYSSRTSLADSLQFSCVSSGERLPSLNSFPEDVKAIATYKRLSSGSHVISFLLS